MNRKEQTRLMVLIQVDRGQVTASQATEMLHLSLHQVGRLLAAYRKEGAAALAHGNRGRTPPNALAAVLRQQVVDQHLSSSAKEPPSLEKQPAGPCRLPSREAPLRNWRYSLSRPFSPG